MIRALTESLTREAAAAFAGQPEGIHHARVAARRLREALALVTGVPEGDARVLRLAARRLRSALGPVREADVRLGLVDELAARYRWPAVEVGRVRLELLARRAAAAQLVTRIDLATLLGHSVRITATLEREPRRQAAARRLTRRARARARGLLEAIRQVGPLYEPARLHAVRIAAKKLRYLLELGRDVGPVLMPREIDALRTAQDSLGRLHDLHDLQHAVDAVAAEPPAHRTSRRTLAAMSRAIEAECRALHGAFLLRAGGLTDTARRALLVGTVLATQAGRMTVKSSAAVRIPARRRN